MILTDKETGQEYEVQSKIGGHFSINPITKPKPVDMSVLIGSGIDCIFGDAEDYTVTCTLRQVKDQHGGQMYRSQLDWYIHCNPRMDYWFSAQNFTSVGELIASLDKAGFDLSIHWSSTQEELNGSIRRHQGEVESFLICGLKMDRCWPWEIDK